MDGPWREAAQCNAVRQRTETDKDMIRSIRKRLKRTSGRPKGIVRTDVKPRRFADKKPSPCPFCENATRFSVTVSIPFVGKARHNLRCHGCGAHGPDATTERGALTKWNGLRKGGVR